MCSSLENHQCYHLTCPTKLKTPRQKSRIFMSLREDLVPARLQSSKLWMKKAMKLYRKRPSKWLRQGPLKRWMEHFNWFLFSSCTLVGKGLKVVRGFQKFANFLHIPKSNLQDYPMQSCHFIFHFLQSTWFKESTETYLLELTPYKGLWVVVCLLNGH